MLQKRLRSKCCSLFTQYQYFVSVAEHKRLESYSVSSTAAKRMTTEYEQNAPTVFSCVLAETRNVPHSSPENQTLSHNVTAVKVEKGNVHSEPTVFASETAAFQTNDTIDQDYTAAFLCDVCKKAFTQKSTLLQHVRSHMGENLFYCDVCKKLFAVNSTLLDHQRNHTGVKLYKCDVCKKEFNANSKLLEHQRVHTGEKPYKCDVCGKAFGYKKCSFVLTTNCLLKKLKLIFKTGFQYEK